jgi:hypothetical protein
MHAYMKHYRDYLVRERIPHHRKHIDEPKLKHYQIMSVSLADDVSHERFRLDDYAGARCYLTLSLAERGEFDEGITHGQAGSRLAEAADHLYSVILVCWALAYLYDLRGELSSAVRLALSRCPASRTSPSCHRASRDSWAPYMRVRSAPRRASRCCTKR